MTEEQLARILESSLKECLSKEKLLEGPITTGVFKFLGTVGLTVAAYYILRSLVKSAITDKDTIKSLSRALAPEISKNLIVLEHKRELINSNPYIPSVVKK